jgi:predicted AAA+ superfamily ATPase
VFLSLTRIFRRERLRVMPAVVVTAARQTGKSTLAEQLVPGARRYSTLDDLDAAQHDPKVLVGGPSRVTLDEVQRAPELLRAVKRASIATGRLGASSSRARRIFS